MLAHAIIMLETSYTNKHSEVYELARQIAFLTNGNSNFVTLCTIGQEPEVVHNSVKKALEEDLGISLREHTPF
jgi:hypothetical protein